LSRRQREIEREVKLLGAPIGTRDFTTNFVKKKLEALREVDNAQVEFALFRGCLS